MTRIDVDPEALAAAGRAVTGIGDEFAAAVGTLSSAVSAGAPSGFDPAGVAFGMVYQKSAQALLDAGAAMVNASRNVGFGIGMSATNYSQANAASTVGGGAAPLPTPEKPVEFDTPSCPSSLGGGVMPPFLWSLLQTFIPDTWPDGNAARLRASAGAWQTFASAISGIAGELSGPSGVVGAQRIPEGGAISSAMSELTQSLSDVATEAGNLATQTREFADDVQATQDAIRDLCDRISPSGVFDGIKAVFSGDALDEIKEVADDVKQVLENFGRQVDGRIALMQALITALDGAVVSLQQRARREFTHYLGEDVGGALATALEVPSNVSEGVVKAGLNGIIGIQQLDPTRFASDPEGAGAAWGGILDTLKYATPTGAAMDPIGAFEHGKNVLGGIAHVEDWRADRPGLGLGGVLFEAGSAATGIGAARTGLRGASAAAEAGDAGPAMRAAGSAAEATAPIAGRASEIAAKLDDLTTLADDIPSGAAPGSQGPTLPTSLAEPNVPRVPEAPRVPEMSTSQAVPDGAGPRSESDAPTPHVADVPSPNRTETHPSYGPDDSPSPVPTSSVPDASGQGVPTTSANTSPDSAPTTVSSSDGAGSPTWSTSDPEPTMHGSGSGATPVGEVPSAASNGPSSNSASAEPVHPRSDTPQPPSVGPHETQQSGHGGSHTGSDTAPSSSSDAHGADDGHVPRESLLPGDTAGVPDHGATLRTDDLDHPNADLLDASELDAARDNPTRLTDALAEGLPSSDPRVMDLVPEDFDKYGGLGKDEWERRYWPSGELDAHGNPKLNWPNPDRHPEGFLSPEDRRPAVLEPGTSFDRFGPGFGRFVSPEGTPFPERGLPFHSLDDGYHQYEVVRELPVWEGPIAPAMGQSGGGIQYYLPYSVVDLLIAGYIREVT